MAALDSMGLWNIPSFLHASVRNASVRTDVLLSCAVTSQLALPTKAYVKGAGATRHVDRPTQLVDRPVRLHADGIGHVSSFQQSSIKVTFF